MQQISPARKRIPLWKVLFCSLIIVKALMFSVFIPPWLGNDEPNHFEYVQYIANGQWDLPKENIVDSLNLTGYWKRSEMRAPQPGKTKIDQTSLMEHAGSFVNKRPELYYYLASIVLKLAPSGDILMGLFAVRLFSAMLSIITLVVLFKTLLIIAKNHPHDTMVALAGTAAAAFHPQFAYISGVANSDNLAILICTMGFYYGARVLDAKTITNTDTLIFLLLVITGIVTKRFTAILIPYFISIYAYIISLRGINVGRALKQAFFSTLFIVCLFLVFALIFPLSVISGIERIIASLQPDAVEAGVAAFRISAGETLRALAILFVTFWFTYGQMVYKMSIGWYFLFMAGTAAVIYGFFRILLSRGESGAAGAGHQHIDKSQLGFALFFILLNIGPILFKFLSPSETVLISGRYLLYSVAPLSAVLAAGTTGLLPKIAVGAKMEFLAILFLLINIIAFFCYLLPIYYL